MNRRRRFKARKRRLKNRRALPVMYVFSNEEQAAKFRSSRVEPNIVDELDPPVRGVPLPANVIEDLNYLEEYRRSVMRGEGLRDRMKTMIDIFTK